MMISNVEFLFMNLSAICMSALGKSLFKSSAHFFCFFFTGRSVFISAIDYMNYLFWILDINLLIRYMI